MKFRENVNENKESLGNHSKTIQYIEEHFRLFFEFSPLSTLLLDSKGNIIDFNSAAVTLLGFPSENLAGKSFFDFMPEKNRDQARNKILEKISGGSYISSQEYLINGDKKCRIETVVYSFVANKKIKLLLYLYIPSTGHKKNMEEMCKMAGVFAHSFNNQLTTIMGFSGMLINEFADGTQEKEDINQVIVAAEHAATLNRRFTFIDENQEQTFNPLDINYGVKRLDAFMRYVLGPNADIEINLDENIGLINLEPRHHEQIMVNFVMNAKEVMLDKVRLSVQTLTESLSEEIAHKKKVMPGIYSVLLVRSTGIETTSGDMEELINFYFTTSAGNKSIGLGFFTINRIVEVNKGFIEVHSDSNESIFKIYFPQINVDDLNA